MIHEVIVAFPEGTETPLRGKPCESADQTLHLHMR